MPDLVRDDVWALLTSSWNPTYGYTPPNRKKYPHQWLWDSCFHAIARSQYRDPRALTELTTALSAMRPDGFLPNMQYFPRSLLSRLMWKNASQGTSDITQPPMYGHAIRVLASKGYDVSHLVESATRGLTFLMTRRLVPETGLVRIVHPWESGCDDIPRWDSWHPGRFHRMTWNVAKYYMLRRVVLRNGASVANPSFDVCSAGFNALVAFNAYELAAVTHDAALVRRADALVANLEKTWNPATGLWDNVTLGPRPRPSNAAPTLDGLLPLLVSKNRAHVAAAWKALADPEQFWGAYGPRSVSKASPAYNPDGYWRGGVWGQMTYLLWVAASRRRSPLARPLAASLVRGAEASTFAEHWNPETGRGNGAVPLGFSTLAAAVPSLG